MTVRIRLWRAILCAPLVALGIASATLEAEGQFALATDRTLLPGDAIQLQVWGQPLLSGEFNVDAEGRLIHPLYKSVVVTGVPLSVAETRLVSVMKEHHRVDPQYSFQPLLRIAVEGEVRQPGIVRYPPDVTVGQAIALAGGVTDRGKLSKVRLVRGGEIIQLDLRDPTDADQHVPIRSGDRILVDRHGGFGRYFLATVSVVGTAASIANLLRRRR